MTWWKRTVVVKQCKVMLLNTTKTAVSERKNGFICTEITILVKQVYENIETMLH